MKKFFVAKLEDLFYSSPKCRQTPIFSMDLLEWSVFSQNAELSMVTVMTIAWLLSCHLLFRDGYISL